jgi:DNA-binding protein HU-beta
MAKALSKSQIAAAIAEKSTISKKQAVEILEQIAQLAYKNAKNSFTLPGLGKLVLVNRKARQGRNPATGEVIQIPPSAWSNSAWPRPPKTPSSEPSNPSPVIFFPGLFG